MTNNIKSFSVTNDGELKRIAITYDVIDETGKIVKANVKINRLLVDKEALEHVDFLYEFCQGLIE